jgi:hypothetical protein
MTKKINLDRPLVIHKGSLLLGAALVAGIGLALGAAQVLPSNPRFLRIQLDPHPSTVVRIVEGTPYTVPAGAMLSVRVLGMNDYSGTAGTASLVLKLGAVQVMNVNTDNTYDIGFPLVAPAGTVVSVEESYPSNADAFALGYLTY